MERYRRGRTRAVASGRYGGAKVIRSKRRWVKASRSVRRTVEAVSSDPLLCLGDLEGEEGEGRNDRKRGRVCAWLARAARKAEGGGVE